MGAEKERKTENVEKYKYTSLLIEMVDVKKDNSIPKGKMYLLNIKKNRLNQRCRHKKITCSSENRCRLDKKKKIYESRNKKCTAKVNNEVR